MNVRARDLVDAHREEIRRIVARHRALNPRIFGSVARDSDDAASDIDLLVDAEPGATLMDLGALQIELEDLVKRRVDVLVPGDIPPSLRAEILAACRSV
jgi:predicted nucleotidyltransferase